jgi:outer membrane protein TolC
MRAVFALALYSIFRRRETAPREPSGQPRCWRNVCAIINAQVSVPVGGGLTARLQAQSALLDAARARREGVLRGVALEVGAAARTAAASVEAEDASDAALVAAKAELDAASLGYARGASTSLDVTTSRATYVQAVVDALSARLDRLQAGAVLALEVGP